MALLLATAVYALAEDLTLTTYHPSPRGIYQELSAAGNVQVDSVAPLEVNPPRLRVVQDQPAPAPALWANGGVPQRAKLTEGRHDDSIREGFIAALDATGRGTPWASGWGFHGTSGGPGDADPQR